MAAARPFLLMALMAATGWSAAAAPAAAFGHKPVARSGFTDIPFATWSDEEPEYRFFPGDEIDIQTPTAPELSRSVVVAPDGRIRLPMIGAVMAADRSPEELEQTLSQAYAADLVRPEVQVGLKTAAPMRVFVGGEVGAPGVIEVNGDMDALQAVIAAGGFKPTAQTHQVVILRRGGGDQAMIRTADLAGGLKGGPRFALRRFDIVYVPRSTWGEITTFVGTVRDSLPVGFSYALGGY